ncbi:probable alpha-mannosidase At5g13980 isoform X2 [Humulus lupulus]|uniref:probable alpha-mannosidase At5g13980 isoform X2 n=1 Tax=Humulus lupulus TaxID=3486 RepID=UPI002B41203B|nr:probable alpha-mannosidase At5g13980 isoform X2 [Humulus lupulus]
MAIKAWFLVFMAALLSCGDSKYIAYNTTSAIVSGKINVHLVPHTHDDVGWLKTIDQYYVGSNNSIQDACVQNVLDSLIPALLADKNRKFIYVEQAFFQRWWDEQSEVVKSIVKKLVSYGQLELINGGMCMHDEAATHYIDMIDQTTLGHRFIKAEFNITPRIGWQIDPFGHSAVQAYLLGAEVGFDSFFFGRIDYQDRTKRKNEKALEVVWRGSKSLGSSSQIFAGAFPENYEPPSRFYYEVNSGTDDPIVQDNPNLFDYNVMERVNEFVAAAISQDGRVNALYSTPSIYTDAKHAADESWPLKNEDYFPYADRVNAYWTGYFTSRPALKGYVRVTSGYYLAARQLEFFRGRSKVGPNTDYLADALAIAQHHDAVSGTSKQHVADDYAKRIAIGYNEAKEVVAESLSQLTDSTSKTGYNRSSMKYQQCPLLNISYCPPSEVDLSKGKDLVIVVYNPLGWKREDVVKIPIVDENVVVKDFRGKEIESQVIPLSHVSVAIRKYHAKAYLGKYPKVTPRYWLAFSATVPPLGFSSYTVSSAKRTAGGSERESVYVSDRNEDQKIQVGSGNLKLVYSEKNGELTKYINKRSMVEESVEQSFGYYSGDDGSVDFQASGAYIFRPNVTYPIKYEKKVPLTVFRGPILDEVHQKINPWIYQITRVFKQKEHAEFEFAIGPIPIDDGIGKEIVTKISSSLKSNKKFYTDTNGRDFIERIRDYRKDWKLEVNQPVAGNYYPINLGIYTKDKSSELSLLVDRAVGGSSIVDGQLELMLHRRLLRDDGRGVAEALNETVCISDNCQGLTIVGKYYLRIDPLGEGAKWRRSYGQELYSPFLLAFTEQDGHNWNSHVSTFYAMSPSYALPDNVAILTLQELESGEVLLRLAHLYEVGEDKDLSIMASVELKKVFNNKKINSLEETSLSANQKRAEMEKKRLVWKVEGSYEEPKVSRGRPVDPTKLVVELAPMEVRTFIISFYS